MSEISTFTPKSPSNFGKPAAAAKAKASYGYKLFRVTRATGKVTTVSMCPVLATTALRALGSSAALTNLVKEAAKRYDPNEHREKHKSCSGFVQSKVQDVLAAHVATQNALRASAARATS